MNFNTKSTHRTLQTALVLSTFTFCSWTLSAKDALVNANWHQWRGPKADGVAPLGNPPTKWSETENIKWKFEIPGYGTSTPIIWENKVFVLTAIKGEPKEAAKPEPAPQTPPPAGGRGGGFGRGQAPTDPHKFVILCLDRATGKVLWQSTAREEIPHEGHHQDHGFASASPITDGTNLFVNFGSRGLYCLDLNGKIKWEQDFGNMQTRNGFGEGTSPALHGDILVVNWDHEGDDFVVALDKNTGKTLWKNQRTEPTSWATPLIIETANGPQVIINATQRIRSYDLKTGKQLWECSGQTVNVIPSPVTGHGLVYCLSGFRGAMLQAIRPDRTGDLSGTDAIAWSLTKATPYVPSPLLYDDYLYFYSGNTAILSIYEAKTGKPILDAHRLTGLSGVYSSPVGAGGRVYLAGRDGSALVLKKSDQLEVLASNKLDDKFDASPAIVGNQLFLRGQKNLYCIE